MAGAADQKPLALVYICDEEFLDVEGGRVDLLRAYYESQGYRVRFVRVPAATSWLADNFEGSHLRRMTQSSLREALLVHVEAHLRCSGLVDKHLEEEDYILPAREEEDAHADDLRELIAPLQAWLRKLGNTRAKILTFLYNPADAKAKSHGVYGVSNPI